MTILRLDQEARDAEGRHVDDQAEELEESTPAAREGWREVALGLPLVVPMAAGVALAWGGMYEAARPWFEPSWLGALVPIAVDGAILGCGVQWVAAAGRRATHGWRTATHAFVALTVILNALAAPDSPTDKRPLVIGLHIGGPIVWAVLAELLARQASKRHQAQDGTEVGRIPLGMWLTAREESWRAKRLQWRTGERNAHVARIASDLIEVADHRLSRILQAGHEAELDKIRRHMAAGSVRTEDVLAAISSHDAAASPDLLVEACFDLALASATERLAAARSGDSLARSGRRASRRASRRVGESPRRMGERVGESGERVSESQASEQASDSPAAAVGERASRRVGERVGDSPERVSERTSESGDSLAPARRASRRVGESQPSESPTHEDDIRRVIEAYDLGRLALKANGEIAEATVRDFLGNEPGRQAGPSRARPAHKAVNAHIRASRNGHTNPQAQQYQTA